MVRGQYREHISNVELWLPAFPTYKETLPFLEQLRANRGVPTAATQAKDPVLGTVLHAGRASP